MSERIVNVPVSAAALILLQRTSHSLVTRIPILRRLLLTVGYRPILRLEAKFRAGRITTAYAAEVEAEFRQLEEYLPEDVRRILDIGCGVGGMSARLLHKWRERGVHVHLADRTQTEERVWYGLEERGAFYNSLDVAREVVASQGFGEPSTFEVDGVTDDLGIDGPVDLVISLLSWGYHYPLDFYWDRMMTILRPGGTLIIDVREGSGGRAHICEQFDVRAQFEVPSGMRIVATKR